MYKKIAIAGTFDRLHKGHRFFISEAFKYGDQVIIGLTSDKYVSNFKILNLKFEFKFKIENFKLRKRRLEKYLIKKKLQERTQIIEINDVYGPAVDPDSEIEALVVTKETLRGGREVNIKRKTLGLEPLPLKIVNLVPAEDDIRISSTRIRDGEIDREGNLYRLINQKSKIKNQKYKSKVKSLTISGNIRQELKKPQGVLLEGDPDHLMAIGSRLKKEILKIKPVFIITVGDEVTKIANRLGIRPNLMIFDFRVNRMQKYATLEELGLPKPKPGAPLGNGVREIENPAGYITKELVEAVSREIREIKAGERVKGKGLRGKGEGGRIIKINGEDDLAAVPAILLAPLGSLVLYGQPPFARASGGKPDSGVVIVEVTEEKKREMVKLLNDLGQRPISLWLKMVE